MRDSKQEILHFWFDQTQPQQWFQKNDDFDAEIRDRFLLTYEMARDGLCDSWSQDAEGCLALCILLDQFPRNMFRGRPAAFATDAKARLIAGHAIAAGFDQLMPAVRRRFLYLPFEHSEDLADQEKSLRLFEKIRKQDPVSYDYAQRHHQVIRDFGRFPHRNIVLGRASTPAEDEYLAKPGSGF